MNQLDESEGRYRQLFQKSPAVLLLIDPLQGGIVDANPAACAYYGYSHDEITGLEIADINTLSADRLHEVMQAVISGRRSQFFFNHRLAHGQIRNVEVFSGPVDIGGRELLYSIVHDVTDRNRAEDRLRQLNATLEQKVAERTRLAETRAKELQSLAIELIRAEERERQRIADLLHDDLQQLLASACMRLSTTGEGRPADPALEGVAEILTKAMNKSRRLSHEISPAMMQQTGLDAGIRRLAEQMTEWFGMEVRLELASVPLEGSELLTVFILRAARELLFNVVKHSGRQSARVALGRSNGYLCVTVSDKGCGFEPDRLETGSSKSGLGLLKLRQRARYIGGDLVIESAAKKGSRIVLKVPFDLNSSSDSKRNNLKIHH